jgi:hypothetical protein
MLDQDQDLDSVPEITDEMLNEASGSFSAWEPAVVTCSTMGQSSCD